MEGCPPISGSLWFVTLVAMLASLGAYALIGALTPLTAFHWLDHESRQGPLVLVAGQAVPSPATPMQLALWAAAAPLASLAVGLLFRVWKGAT